MLVGYCSRYGLMPDQSTLASLADFVDATVFLFHPRRGQWGESVVLGVITERGRTALVVVTGNLTAIGINCSALSYSVHPSSGQQRHIPAGQR
jgi:hypothetical protein